MFSSATWAYSLTATPTTSYTGNYVLSWGTLSYNSGTVFLGEYYNGVAGPSLIAPPQPGTWNRTNQPAGTYTYQISWCGGVGFYCTNASDVTVVVVPFSPATISSPTNNSNGSFSVSWTASVGATTYQLDQSTDAGASWNTVLNGNATSYGASGGNGTYYYRVRACAGGYCSAYTGNSATTILLPPSTPILGALPPTSSTGLVNVGWGDVASATYYQLDQITNGSLATSNYYSPATLANLNLADGYYQFQLRACNASGCSGNSNVQSVSVTHLPASAPVLSGIPSFSATGAFTPTWSSVANATSYQVDQLLGGGTWGTVYNGSANSFAVSGLGNGTYSYQIRACNPGGCSANSAPSSVVVGLPPGSISGPTSNDGASSYPLSWVPSATATSYNLQERFNGGSWATIYSGVAPSYSVSGRGLGVYTYQVQACFSGGGCSGYSVPFTVTVAFGNSILNSLAPATMPSIAQADINNWDKIGSTEGTFRVNESGAATYKIPFFAVPGTAGVTPQFGISYNSQGSNGLVGQGWSITGLSGISRCRQTLQQDNNPLPITWTNTDRFCLDGQRLLLVSGSNYGDVGAVYHTEIESYATVTSVGGSSGNPDYFTVTRKDGSTTYFGNTPSYSSTDAKIINPTNSVTLTWAIKKFQDNIGNPIWYLYANDTYGQRLSEVRYAYGSAADPAPSTYNARLIFNYTTTRPDPLKGYLAGMTTLTQGRLSSVVSENALSAVRTYTLNYKDIENPTPIVASNSIALKLSRMTSIQECGLNGICLPPTQFTWTDTAPQVGFSTATPITSSLNAAAAGSSVDMIQPFDVDGDGCTDYVWHQTSSVESALYYAVSDCAGHWKTGYFDTGSSWRTISANALNIQIMDYNGDGRSDVLVTTDLQNWVVFLSVPRGDGTWMLSSTPQPTALTSSVGTFPAFADINADGLGDVLSFTTDTKALVGSYTRQLLAPDTTQTASSSHFYRFGAPTTPAYTNYLVGGVLTVSDVNGDGQSDIAYKPPVSGRALILSFFPAFQFLGNTGNSTSDERYFRLVDLNGDGLPDMVFPLITSGVVQWVFQLNTGNGFAAPVAIGGITSPMSPLTAKQSQVDFVDYNRDGHPDFLYFDPTANQLKLLLWNPSTQGFDPPLFLMNTSPTAVYSIVDVNGDGAPDLVARDGTGKDAMSVWIGNGADQPRHMITAVTNGLGAQTTINYGNLMKGGIYDRLQVAGTSSTTTCHMYIPFVGGSSYPCTNTVAYPDAFYSALNGPWDFSQYTTPAGTPTQFLQKASPVLEWVAPVYVVSEVVGSAPATSAAKLGSVSTIQTSKIAYSYGDAKLQAGGRGMLGFQYVKVLDEQTNVVTTTTYRQDFPFIGYPIKTEVKTSDGKLIRTSITDWQFQDWTATGGNPAWPLKLVIGGTQDKNYDIDSANTLVSNVKTLNTYDSLGNVLSQQVSTYNDDAATPTLVSSKLAINTYSSTAGSRGRLTQTVVKNNRPNQVEVKRTSAFSYYCIDGASCPSSLYSGMLYQEVVEPSSAYTVTTTHEYTLVGNPAKITVSGTDIASRYTRWEYDNLGRFKDRTFNSLEQKTEDVSSRNNLGQPTTVNGLNGSQLQFGYGPLGRKYLEYSNMGAYTITSRAATLSGLCPAGTALADWMQKSDGSQAGACYDIVVRPTRSISVGFNSTYIFSDTEYDSLGRVKNRSIPYSQGAYSSAASIPVTTVGYDIVGRVTQTLYPDASKSTAVYSGLKTELKDDHGFKKTEYRNALSELDHVVDHYSTQVKYAYFGDGTLSSTTTVAGNAGVASIKVATGVPSSIVTTFQYDLLGRKISMADPDKGTWTYAYYTTGELKAQTDAKGQVVAFQYDQLGRTTHRTDTCGAGSVADGCSSGTVKSNVTWTYDTAANGVGQLAQLVDSVTGYAKVIAYDNLGRAVSTGVSPANGENYYQRVAFDQFGRAYQQYDASGTLNGVTNVYNANGYLAQVKDAASNQPYYVVNAMDAMGHVTNESNGAATTARTYDSKMGRLTNIVSTVINLDSQTGMQTTQNLQYAYDTVGNLQQRADLNSGLTEAFLYDGLNRVYSDTVGTNPATTISYDSFGNIATKNGLTYSYGAGSATCSGAGVGSGSHAALNVGGTAYTYDCNGNNRTGDGRTLQYSVFDKPTNIAKGSFSSTFQYDADRSLLKRIDNNGSQLTTTVYIGNVERVIKSDNSYELRRYVAGALVTQKYGSNGVAANSTNQYVLKDHLGSTDVIIDQHGTVVSGTGNTTKQKQSFDPWGLRRDSGTWIPMTTTLLAQFDHSVTNKGFTGHEMLDELGIIHMRGRIYDPKIGRFLQADPTVQFPTATQSYNRYSYLLNNPLNDIDPSGYGGLSSLFGLLTGLGKDINPVKLISMAVCAYVTVQSAGMGAGCFAFTTAAMTNVQGGSWWQSLRAGAIAGASSYAFSQLGPEAAAGDGVALGEIGVVGGVASTLQGGKFGDGFLSAGFSAWGGPQLGPLVGQLMGETAGRIIASMVIGGTASEITGGKFANGAITGAFASAVTSSGESSGRGEVTATDGYDCYGPGCSGVGDGVPKGDPTPWKQIPDMGRSVGGFVLNGVLTGLAGTVRLAGAVNGAVIGGVGGYTAAGWRGVAPGAATGAVVGAVSPWVVDAAGTGLPGVIAVTGTGAASGTAGALSANIVTGQALSTGVPFAAATGALSPLISGEAFMVGGAGIEGAAANWSSSLSGGVNAFGGAMDPGAEHGFMSR